MSMVSVDSNRFTASTIRGEPASPPMSTYMPALPHTPGYAPVASTSTRRCYCGTSIDAQSGNYYCSPDCARGDAFSSLTHARSTSVASSLGDAFDDRSSRATSASSDYDDASHYRRMKRDERRQRERMLRNGEGSISPETTRSPSAVPDLVSSHSRNTSTASSIFSFASCSSLSRNPSTSSHAPYTTSVVIDDAIMEDDDEVSAPSARSTLRAQRRRRPTDAVAKELAPGTGVPAADLAVNDMLDEIINMEESFRVPDDVVLAVPQPRPATPERARFVPTVVRPPRTPSPVLGRRGSVVPSAPNAPDRRSSRRNSMVQQRPPSMYAHQSSLSESHTALYLATASPVAPAPKPRHRRSASPKLTVRRSLTFTPQAAGPALSHPPRNRYDSPGLTPVRRKHLTPNAHHPPMGGWRFPTASSDTPTHSSYDGRDPTTPMQPQLLWPDGSSQEQQQQHAPSSPAFAPRYSPDDELFHMAPSSALRLGMLMNSNDDIDSDDASTVRGSIRQSFAAPAAPFTQPGW